MINSNFKFKSRYTDKLVGSAQYLAEIMIERQAKKQGLNLPNNFWNKDEWKRNYMIQLRLAYSLLKLYCVEAILIALKTPQGKKIYSLGAKWLDSLYKIEQNKISNAKGKQEKVVIIKEDDEERLINKSINEIKIKGDKLCQFNM